MGPPAPGRPSQFLPRKRLTATGHVPCFPFPGRRCSWSSVPAPPCDVGGRVNVSKTAGPRVQHTARWSAATGQGLWTLRTRGLDGLCGRNDYICQTFILWFPWRAAEEGESQALLPPSSHAELPFPMDSHGRMREEPQCWPPRPSTGKNGDVQSGSLAGAAISPVPE